MRTSEEKEEGEEEEEEATLCSSSVFFFFFCFAAQTAKTWRHYVGPSVGRRQSVGRPSHPIAGWTDNANI
jgi:hypothetical protein